MPFAFVFYNIIPVPTLEPTTYIPSHTNLHKVVGNRIELWRLHQSREMPRFVRACLECMSFIEIAHQFHMNQLIFTGKNAGIGQNLCVSNRIKARKSTILSIPKSRYSISDTAHIHIPILNLDIYGVHIHLYFTSGIANTIHIQI
jgi:hypothetical protein